MSIQLTDRTHIRVGLLHIPQQHRRGSVVFYSKQRLRITQPVRAVLAQVLYPVQWLILQPVEFASHGRSYFQSLQTAQEDLDAARKKMTVMGQRANQADQLAMENQRLRKLLELRDRLLRMIAADREWHESAARTKLLQILYNLLSNAIKYNHHGGEIQVHVSCTDEQVQFAVSDTGAGLSAEQLSHLFEPFNRLGAENSSIQGTGIGLVLCRHLAQAMEGRIDVSSVPGVGSTFALCLHKSAPPDIHLNDEKT